jgi:glutamate-5-semialdehyde dehydrogenase
MNKDTTISSYLFNMGRASKEAARALRMASGATKDRALTMIADRLSARKELVLSANQEDMVIARDAGAEPHILDRLLLTSERLDGIIQATKRIVALPNPIGEEFDVRSLPNGLLVGRRRVPLGVIGTIYESRPNVTIDIAALCLKSGNASILRGGKEAIHSNRALISIVREAVVEADLPEFSVQFVEDPDRTYLLEMLRMKEFIDLLIPRGGSELITFVGQHATMPAITGGIGVCHVYIDRGADQEMASRIVLNAKLQRPSVCNALDTLLVDKNIASEVLPKLAGQLLAENVELRMDSRSISYLGMDNGPQIKMASCDDWGVEFLDLILAVRVVDSIEDALAHIERYGSGHSEAIVTRDHGRAMQFLDAVDAAAVFVNASTRFTDGEQLGLGAEVAISTNKLHARGPMGVRDLTSYKWVILGNGHVRA